MSVASADIFHGHSLLYLYNTRL